jgi:zinc transport system permease protein
VDLLTQFVFIRNMFIAGLLASVACGIIGTYVVVKRLVFISGGIAHTCFGGIGLAYMLGFEPIIGAMLFAVATAVTLGVTSLKTHMREDSTIGVLWVMGMALGVLFISKAPGVVPDPMTILFGSILLAVSRDLLFMLALTITIVLIVAFCYKQLLALTFDEEFARISGVPTERLYVLLLVLIALTVVLLLKVVGVVLAIALLTIPATISSLFTHNMKRMMSLAVLVGMVLVTTGLIVSVQYDLDPGAPIVIVSGIGLILALTAKRLWSRLGRPSGVPQPERQPAGRVQPEHPEPVPGDPGTPR